MTTSVKRDRANLLNLFVPFFQEVFLEATALVCFIMFQNSPHILKDLVSRISRRGFVQKNPMNEFLTKKSWRKAESFHGLLKPFFMKRALYHLS